MESVTDASGTELKIQAYDPFGSRRASDWTRAMTDTERKSLAGEAPQRTSRGYTGHEHLERTGLIHMNGRVYDPAIGRFLSPDPIVADASFSQGWNAYSYALNSPLSYSDPSGMTLVGGCPQSLCSGGGFGGSRGGFGPSSVLATSGHATISVGVIWSVGYGALRSPRRRTTMLYISDPNASGGARGGESLESRAGFGFPTRTPRPFVTVFYQQVRAWVGIGEEQSPADLPIENRQMLAQTELAYATPSEEALVESDLTKLLERIERAEKLGDVLSLAGIAVDVLAGGPTGEGIIISTAVKGVTNKTIKESVERILREHGVSSLRKARRSFKRRLDEHLEKLDVIKKEGGYTSSVEREIRTFQRHIDEIDKILDRL